MELKPGFKQTEAGVIPNEWEAPLARDIGAFRGGNGFPLEAQGERHGAYPFYKVSDMNNEGNETFMTAANHWISEHTRKRLGATAFPADSIVFAKVGAAIFLERKKILGQPSCIDNNMAAFVLDKSRADVRFVHTLLLSKKLGALVATTALPALNGAQLGEMVLPLPPLPEQRAIATALSDVDGLLGGLDRLIAKKRDLKQAAMQQLLTGQTRLPGFHGEWEVKRLKQVAEISTGINKPLSEMGSGALYVTVQDLYDKTSIRTERLSRIKVSPSEIETRGLTSGDIVFGKSSVKRDGIGYPSQFLGCDEPVVFSGFTYRARARQGITDATFLFYALREEKTRRWLIDNSQASALTNINQTIADAIPVQVPPSVPEQTAIAEVLTDMDAELAALEQRREKTRALKHAMMQELLTGRIRLA